MNRNSQFISLLFNLCLSAILLYLIYKNQIEMLEKFAVAKGIAIAILAVIFIYAVCYLIAEFLIFLAVFAFIAVAMAYYFNHGLIDTEIKFKDSVKKESSAPPDYY